MAKRTIDVTISSTGTFRFCGNGEGIPGLPHEVSAAEARALNMLDVLEAAIRNGSYKLIATVAVEHGEGKESE